jgi:hypothetical protein
MKKQGINLAAKTPRSLEELQKIAGQLTFEYGNSKYQEYVHAKEADRLAESLELINAEGAARNDLDKKVQS